MNDPAGVGSPYFFNPIEENKLDYEYFGFSMQQNRYAIPVIGILLEYAGPSRIIEFGTRHGGLSVFLGLYAKNKDIRFYTYDIKNQIAYGDLFEFLGIRFVEVDIFSEKAILQITRNIQKGGRSIVFCDGLKAREFNLYADYLKPDDIILAHDFAQDERDFTKIQQQSIWWHNELTFRDIEDSCRRNNLQPVFPDLFRTAAWCCFVKK